ncbi:MAG TPA: Gfo/Idh/MocA family oxidoreductase [Candidatus Hydrogenedentes bacterium]|nr:Gfo/Idh/MocA family oxidoreductase [Candidatus Hydrogenedentota bacterium]HPG65408.1 Gfo/Idh/MocA family oxidoreductase [Candidatus Hydrogenedentota bacterium]
MAKGKRAMNVGIVGLGHLHPRAYMTLFNAVAATEVVAVTDENDALRESFCKDFGVRGYASLDAMLKQEPLDIAAIFLPHCDCPAAAVKCAKRGIHLMVEKPVAADAKGALHIARAADQARVKFTTGYCWRFHPVARELRRLVQAGAVGSVVGAEGRCAAGGVQRYVRGNSAWMLEKARSGGGPIYNLGVHWIDLFRWILDDEAIEVSGQNVKVNSRYDIEDNSFAHVRFSKGAILALDISYTVPDAYPHGRDLYVSVRGTKGVISWAPAFEGEKDVLNICSDAPEFGGSPLRTQEFELAPTPGYAGYMGLEYVRNFADAIIKGARPAITGDDAVAALKVVEAVYKSADEKRWCKVG